MKIRNVGEKVSSSGAGIGSVLTGAGLYNSLTGYRVIQRPHWLQSRQCPHWLQGCAVSSLAARVGTDFDWLQGYALTLARSSSKHLSSLLI